MGTIRATGVVFTAVDSEEFDATVADLPGNPAISNVVEDAENLMITFDIDG